MPIQPRRRKNANHYQTMQSNLEVLNFLLENDGPISPSVVESVFHDFYDVEIPLPIPAMRFSEKERNVLASQIINEMFPPLNELLDLFGNQPSEEINSSYDTYIKTRSDQMNLLWKELAGCFPEEINSLVMETIKPEQGEVLYSEILDSVCATFNIPVEEVIHLAKTDGAFRNLLRMHGIDPDKFHSL